MKDLPVGQRLFLMHGTMQWQEVEIMAVQSSGYVVRVIDCHHRKFINYKQTLHYKSDMLMELDGCKYYVIHGKDDIHRDIPHYLELQRQAVEMNDKAWYNELREKLKQLGYMGAQSV
ncbi:hypothetical protein A374_08879 [Fictibacillus macauensis ZFHKF-1]|uniref:IDEAL domain-containing protein n=1 Tax=Fictibacillus macauensis ZFHKF-1 TaxID=1196324 RepID=I8AJH1_9BACL|nr:hypothetical protein [Fictibacillus macauensis]EIT85937.1 hypothetical protein A374_08879 [Fictibacillus macauensis ZFHKF-1]